MIRFGTDGWRAEIADEFTFNNVRIVTHAIANYLNKTNLRDQSVVIGYDNRFQSENFAETAARVLNGNGIKSLITNSSVPTPTLSYSVKSKNAGAGLMITASHNPGEYNGIKFKANYAGSASPMITAEIEKELNILLKQKSQTPESKDPIEKFDPRKSYLEALKKIVNPDIFKNKKIKVVVDYMNGSGSGYLSELLKDHLKVIEINNFRDPLFGGKKPEPIPVNLEELISQVREIALEDDSFIVVGFALDGDADRIAAVDGSGLFINSHNIFSILLKHLVEDKKLKGDIVKTFNISTIINKQAKDYGLKLHETSIGFKYVCDLMLSSDILLGGEESGGFGVKGHIPERDGIMMALLLLEAVAMQNKSLGSILSELFKKYGNYSYNRSDLILDEKRKPDILTMLQNFKPKSFCDQKVAKIENLDGTKIFLEDESWILFRPSGTEPLLRIYVEARSDDQVKQILAEGEKLILHI